MTTSDWIALTAVIAAVATAIVGIITGIVDRRSARRTAEADRRASARQARLMFEWEAAQRLAINLARGGHTDPVISKDMGAEALALIALLGPERVPHMWEERVGKSEVLAEILGTRVYEMTRGSATEELIGAVDGIADALANLMGAAGSALAEYAVQLQEAAELVDRHARHAEAGVREAVARLRALIFPVSAVAMWAGEVAATQGSLREDFEIRASDIVRMRELANADQVGEAGDGEYQAEA